MDLISKRATVARDWKDFLDKYLGVCCSDPYEETMNPEGYVNLGTSVNNLCMDIIKPKLCSEEIWSCNPNLLQYHEAHGILRLREAFANLMTQFLETYEPVNPENIFCLAGVTSCVDILAHCLADPGEAFLSPTPTYGRVYTDFKHRALVEIVDIPVIDKDTEGYSILTMEKVTEAYESAIIRGQKIKGMFLINPGNPLGEVFSPELLMDILSFCHLHSLHIIIDEVYALSVHSEEQKFYSVLKFPKLPDPERTHILYGLSKDFGIAGLRIGTIHTQCKPLQETLIQLAIFENIPFPVMDIVAKYLEDLEWCKKYVSINKKRLAEKCHYTANYLKKIGLNVRKAYAGFFLWVDFRSICRSFDEEMKFFEFLIDYAHLYIVPGKEFYCAQPGWFRIVFALHDKDLNQGLKRLEKAIKVYKAEMC